MSNEVRTMKVSHFCIIILLRGFQHLHFLSEMSLSGFWSVGPAVSEVLGNNRFCLIVVGEELQTGFHQWIKVCLPTFYLQRCSQNNQWVAPANELQLHHHEPSLEEKLMRTGWSKVFIKLDWKILVWDTSCLQIHNFLLFLLVPDNV